MTPPVEKIQMEEGISLPITLKPPKMPKNFAASKKTYKNLFIRSLKHSTEHHIYSHDGFYICSLYKSLDDAKLWIDKRYDEIQKRIEETVCGKYVQYAKQKKITQNSTKIVEIQMGTSQVVKAVI